MKLCIMVVTQGLEERNMRKRNVAMVCMAFALAGCSSSATTNSNQEQTLTVGLSSEMNGDFSPLYYRTTNDASVVSLVYQSLLKYDEKQNLVCDLASELPLISEDGTSITFKLKKGIQFSDGTKFTSKDVKDTFSVMADPSYTGLYSSKVDFLQGYNDYHDGDAKEFAGIETPDDYTVVFHLEKPRIDAEAAIGTQCICSDKTLDYTKGKTSKIEKKNTKPVGTGPYVLKSYDKSVGASLEKNEHFKAKKGTYSVSKIMIKKTDSSTEVKELEKGTIDYIPEVTDANKISSVKKSDNKDLTLDSYNGDRENWMYLNMTQGPCQDQAVRQALAYGFDRQSYIDSYYKLEGSDEVMAYIPQAFGNPVSKNCGDIITGKETLDGLDTYEYNPEKAKQLLEDAGWKVGDDGYRYKDGKKLTIRFLSIKEKDNMDSMIPILQKNWNDIGVELKASTMEFNSVVSTISDENALSDWDAGWLGFSYGSPEDTGVNYLIKSKAIDNFPRLNDEELDADLDAATYTADSEQSAQYFKKALIRQADLCGFIPTDGVKVYGLRNKKVKGMHTTSTYRWYNSLETVKIK